MSGVPVMANRALFGRVVMLAGLALLAPTIHAYSDDSLHQHVTVVGSVHVAVQIDKPIAMIADPVTLTLQVTAPNGSKVDLPQLGQQLGELTVIDVDTLLDIPIDKGSSARTGDQRHWTLQATLETIFTGEHQIPPLEVLVRISPDKTAAPEEVRILSKPIDLKIASVLNQPVDPNNPFREVKDVIDVEVPNVELPKSARWRNWAIGFGLAVLALGVAAWWRYRNKPVAIETWALSELDHLEAGDLESATPPVVYGKLTDIVRRFLRFKFGHDLDVLLDGGDQTKTDSPSARIPSEALDSFRDFLRDANNVKFAKRPVTRDQITDAIRRMRRLIETCATPQG